MTKAPVFRSLQSMLALLSAVVFANTPDAVALSDTGGPAAAAASEVTYTLDPSKTWLYVIVTIDKSTIGSALGHDHAIAATGWSGSVTWPAPGSSDWSKCSVRIDVPVSGLKVDPPGYREHAGLDADGAVGDKDKATITGNFKGKRQLDASTHSKISFRSTSCAPAGDKVSVKGTLTIRGVGATVTAPMTVSHDGTSFSASGRFSANHTDFGFKPFTAALGALKNNNKLTFVINTKGKAK